MHGKLTRLVQTSPEVIGGIRKMMPYLRRLVTWTGKKKKKFKEYDSLPLIPNSLDTAKHDCRVF
jgi:hypothetical protein